MFFVKIWIHGPAKGASFKVIQAIKEMNKAEEEELESENGTIDL